MNNPIPFLRLCFWGSMIFYQIVTVGFTNGLTRCSSVFRVSWTIISNMEGFVELDIGNLKLILLGNLNLRKSSMGSANAISRMSPISSFSGSVDLINELEKSIDYLFGSNRPTATLSSFWESYLCCLLNRGYSFVDS